MSGWVRVRVWLVEAVHLKTCTVRPLSPILLPPRPYFYAIPATNHLTNHLAVICRYPEMPPKKETKEKPIKGDEAEDVSSCSAHTAFLTLTHSSFWST